MGFRNPITTAEGVDTGESSTGPGARMYQLPNYGGGVVEFRDGVSGDQHATISRPVNVFDQGDGVLRVQGGTFSIDAGTVNGVDAGSLDFVVQEAPLGGYESVVKLRGGRLDVPGLPIPVDDQAERDALAKFKGLQVIRLDTPTARVETWDGGTWRFRLSGVFGAVGDQFGSLFVLHGAGKVPTAWGAVTTAQASDLLSLIVDVVLWDQTANHLHARIRRNDTNQWLGGNPVTFHWWAEF